MSHSDTPFDVWLASEKKTRLNIMQSERKVQPREDIARDQNSKHYVSRSACLFVCLERSHACSPAMPARF